MIARLFRVMATLVTEWRGHRGAARRRGPAPLEHRTPVPLARLDLSSGLRASSTGPLDRGSMALVKSQPCRRGPLVLTTAGKVTQTLLDVIPGS